MDARVKEAIAQYEQRVEELTQKRNKNTHISRIEEANEMRKVQKKVAAMESKMDSIANLEPIMLKPTKLV
jgi:uncharacterized protein Yka (UPF0111/DUF47 family)